MPKQMIEETDSKLGVLKQKNAVKTWHNGLEHSYVGHAPCTLAVSKW